MNHHFLGSFFKRFSYGESINPARDWLNLLAITLVLTLASLAWNLWLLAEVERGGALQGGVPPAEFDAASIETVRAVFEARSQEERRYRQEYRFVDPSVEGS